MLLPKVLLRSESISQPESSPADIIRWGLKEIEELLQSGFSSRGDSAAETDEEL